MLRLCSSQSLAGRRPRWTRRSSGASRKKNRLELAEKTRSILNQFASDSGTLLPLQPRPACRQLDESLQEESAERLRAAASTTEVIEGSHPPPSAAARRNRPRADASLTRRARSGGRARALGRCQPAALRAAQHHVAAARVRQRGGGVHPQACSGRPGCGTAPAALLPSLLGRHCSPHAAAAGA